MITKQQLVGAFRLYEDGAIQLNAIVSEFPALCQKLLDENPHIEEVSVSTEEYDEDLCHRYAAVYVNGNGLTDEPDSSGGSIKFFDLIPEDAQKFLDILAYRWLVQNNEEEFDLRREGK